MICYCFFFVFFQIETAKNKPIICYLGVGKLIDATHQTSVGGNAGTLTYQHKEQLEGKTPTSAADVYSFAVIMLETYTRCPAWKGYSSQSLRKAILTDNQFPSIGKYDVPPQAQEISAEKRPTFVALLPKIKGLVVEADVW